MCIRDSADTKQRDDHRHDDITDSAQCTGKYFDEYIYNVPGSDQDKHLTSDLDDGLIICKQAEQNFSGCDQENNQYSGYQCVHDQADTGTLADPVQFSGAVVLTHKSSDGDSDVYKRQLQDPLAELVKIEPQSIGVGQYQHDMNQKKLGESLSGVVAVSYTHLDVYKRQSLKRAK